MQKGLELGGSYTVLLENMECYNQYRGIDLRFCLNATVQGFHAVNCSEYAFYQDIGAYPGIPGPANSVSQVVVKGSRVQIPNGGVGAFYFRGGDGCRVKDSVVELAGVGTSCSHGIRYDNAGNTVAKDFKVDNVHFETAGTFSEAMIYLRLQADCTAVISGNWPQQASGSHFILLDNAAGSNTVIIRDMPNTSGANWKLRYTYPGATPGSTGGAGGFVFQNTMLPGNPSLAADIQGNTNIFDMVNYSSPQTGSNRIKLDNRPL